MGCGTSQHAAHAPGCRCASCVTNPIGGTSSSSAPVRSSASVASSSQGESACTPTAAATAAPSAAAAAAAPHEDAAAQAEKTAQQAVSKAKLADQHAQEADEKAEAAQLAARSLAADQAALVDAQTATEQRQTEAELKVEAHEVVISQLVADVAQSRAPVRLCNLPKPCAHFTPRPSVDSRITAAFAQTGEAAPVVCLYGIAGSGKSEIAKRYALAEFESDPTCAAVCWLLNAESAASLHSSYVGLLRKFGLEWKSEDGESDEDTMSRVHSDLQDRLRPCRVTLLFDNAVTFASIQPYLPTKAGVKAHVLITTLHMACMEEDAEAARFSISLNDGLSEAEALTLLASASGVAAAAGASAEHAVCVQLATFLDRLPLGISTAGMYIRAQRAPPKPKLGVGKAKPGTGTGAGVAGSAAGSAAALTYSAADYLADLENHSKNLLVADSQSGTRSQLDYKLGQASALQMSIGRVTTTVRMLLDYCTLLDSQDLPYPLMCYLYTRSCCAVDAKENGGDESPAAVSAAAAAVDAESADAAFQSMLTSADTYSLLYVHTNTNQLSMHRSTQLQLTILAEGKYAADDAGVKSSSAQAAIAASSNPPPTVPSVNRLASTTLRLVTVSPPLADITSAPSALQQWRCDRLSELLTSIDHCWPAEYEETTRLLACAPILPTMYKLLTDSSRLPLLHPSLASVHAQLMRAAVKHMRTLAELYLFADVCSCASTVLRMCEADSDWGLLINTYRLSAASQLGEGDHELASFILAQFGPVPRVESDLQLEIVTLGWPALPVSDYRLHLLDAARAYCERTWPGVAHVRTAALLGQLCRYWSRRSAQQCNAVAAELTSMCGQLVLAKESVRTIHAGILFHASYAMGARGSVVHDSIKVQHLRVAYQLANTVYGRSSQHVANVAERLSLLLLRSRETSAEAWQLMADVEIALIQELGSESMRLADVCLAFGCNEMDAKRYDEAIAHFKRAESICSSLSSDAHIVAIHAMSLRAFAVYEQTRDKSAVRALRAQILERMARCEGSTGDIVKITPGLCRIDHIEEDEPEIELDYCLRIRDRAAAVLRQRKGDNDRLLADQLYSNGMFFAGFRRPPTRPYAKVIAYLTEAALIYEQHASASADGKLRDTLHSLADAQGHVEDGTEESRFRTQMATRERLLRLSLANGDLVEEAEERAAMAALLMRHAQYARALREGLVSMYLLRRALSAAPASVVPAGPGVHTPGDLDSWKGLQARVQAQLADIWQTQASSPTPMSDAEVEACITDAASSSETDAPVSGALPAAHAHMASMLAAVALRDSQPATRIVELLSQADAHLVTATRLARTESHGIELALALRIHAWIMRRSERAPAELQSEAAALSERMVTLHTDSLAAQVAAHGEVDSRTGRAHRHLAQRLIRANQAALALPHARSGLRISLLVPDGRVQRRAASTLRECLTALSLGSGVPAATLAEAEAECDKAE